MDGSSSTSAPFSRRRAAVLEIFSFGRVTRIFQPARGNFSYQAKSSARVQTFPTTIMAGVWIFAWSAAAFRVPTVATTRFWPAVVPLDKTAAGISGSIPAFIRPLQISSMAVIPIRKTRVPFVCTSGSKSMSYSIPLRLCPVITWTEEQKSRCVTGIPLYAGTEIGEVTPGTIS